MKYHTIKSEKTNTRENGKFATYPVYEHETGERVALMDCYSCDVHHFLKLADAGKIAINEAPFYKAH